MAFVPGKPVLIASDVDRVDQRCPYRGHSTPKATQTETPVWGDAGPAIGE